MYHNSGPRSNSVHNGQKDHKCDSCGKSFSQAGFASVDAKVDGVFSRLGNNSVVKIFVCLSCRAEIDLVFSFLILKLVDT